MLAGTWDVRAENATVSSAVQRAKRDKELLIVAAGDHHRLLTPFVAHKLKLLPTEFVALEEILKGEGADDAEKLKRYLYDRWKNHNVGYVLLVGDAGVIPVRYTAISNTGPEAGGWSFMPSDLYYADLATRSGLFDDWNGRKDGFHGGYYGELTGFDGKTPINLDGIDYVPEIAVGRWPVHTTAQTETLVAKTIKYETHILANDDWATRRTAFVNGPGLQDVRHEMTNWAGRVDMVTGHRPVRLLYRDVHRNDRTPPPNLAEVERLLNAGLGMIFHVGHGSETSWDGCLDLGRLATIKNAELPPIMLSVGCTSTGTRQGRRGIPTSTPTAKPTKGSTRASGLPIPPLHPQTTSAPSSIDRGSGLNFFARDPTEPWRISGVRLAPRVAPGD